ncbi:hypothetical protein [Maribacter stanieri]|uniref:Uncharacterized protein n=1 Tax=Maribacter stanieri TaxID=440514 RepID=A0A1I6JUN0_9FLAO|nr:hypothetical protein [Maribacter stanieri]SFR82598.1 hypothetical protein SAMN04488010_3058 [Maribacter stanieri]
MSELIFKIGDIVTLKSHPLAFEESGEMDVYVNQIPPFMCIKEIHYEKKKVLYSKEKSEAKISSNTKYLCTYFNQHRMVFEEKFLFQDFLIPLKKIIFHNKDTEQQNDHIKLIDETINYNKSKYEFGKRVFFKTFKLEKRKKFKSAGHDFKSTTRTTMTHTTPAFILSGFKSNENTDKYSEKSGDPQNYIKSYGIMLIKKNFRKNIYQVNS